MADNTPPAQEPQPDDVVSSSLRPAERATKFVELACSLGRRGLCANALAAIDPDAEPPERAGMEGERRSAPDGQSARGRHQRLQ
jgi:hypothetical protein